MLKKNPQGLKDVQNKAVKRSTLGTFTLDKLPFITILYQTGYLTIKKYDEKFNTYLLGYPNEEIKQSLLILEMSVLTHKEKEDIEDSAYILKSALEKGDVETFRSIIGADHLIKRRIIVKKRHLYDAFH